MPWHSTYPRRFFSRNAFHRISLRAAAAVINIWSYSAHKMIDGDRRRSSVYSSGRRGRSMR